MIETIFCSSIGILFLGLFVYWLVDSAKQRARMLKAEAARLGGRVVSVHPYRTRLEWTEGDVSAEFVASRGTQEDPPRTRTHFAWAPPGRLRVAPEGMWATITKFCGAQDLEIGDADFDDAFLIQGEPENWVRKALSEEVREHLLDLWNVGTGPLNSPAGIRLDVGPSGTTLSCNRYLAHAPGMLRRWIERSRALHEALQEATQSGVRVVDVQEVIAAGRCPVCGDPLGNAATRCDRCRTPHHADCWKLSGGCAIFACASAPAAESGGDEGGGATR